MKRLFIFLLIVVVIGPLSAQVLPNDQNTDSIGKLTKKEQKAIKKEQRRAETERMYNELKDLIDGKRFVLEANFLSNQRGYQIPVNSSLNFIKVDSTTAILQIGSPSGIGANGVGGITAAGNILRWDLKKNEKRKSMYLSIVVMTPIGTYDVTFDINSSGNTFANVSGTSRGQVNYVGFIVSTDESGLTRDFPYNEKTQYSFIKY